MQKGKKMSVHRKTNLSLRLFLAIPACFLTHCLFFIMQSQQFFSVSVVELAQWTILIALFSQSVPPSCVCYCRTWGYAGQGGNAEPAESEHFLSNNLKFCRFIGGLTKSVYGAGGFWTLAGGGGAPTKCQITRSVTVCERWPVLLELFVHKSQVFRLACTCAVAVAAGLTDMCIGTVHLLPATTVNLSLLDCGMWSPTHAWRVNAKMLLFQ